MKPRWTASVRKRSNASSSRSRRTFRDSSLPRPGDEHAQALPRVQNALPLQVGIDPGNRVRIDHQRARKLADRGEPLVGLEPAPRDGLADLMAQLPANRQPAGRVDGELHGHLANCTSNHSTVGEMRQEAFSGSEKGGRTIFLLRKRRRTSNHPCEHANLPFSACLVGFSAFRLSFNPQTAENTTQKQGLSPCS